MSARADRKRRPRPQRERHGGRAPGAVAILALLALLAPLAACGSAAPRPVDIDTRNDTCAWCRMTISETRFAAELLAPSEEPRLFDDIGCLRDYLAASPSTLPRGASAFVADHRTRAWIPASRAVYAQAPGGATPMASGLAAWADAASRSADPDAAAWAPRTANEVFGAAGAPGEDR